MGELMAHGALGMARGSVLRLRDAQGLVLQVHEGALWLTQEGDALDRYLGPGASFRLDRGGLALAQAIGPRTRLTLIPPRRRRPAGFWARLFAAHSGAPAA